MTKLSAAAPSWSPATKLSATAPCFTPNSVKPSPKSAAVDSPKDLLSGASKKFSFSGAAKPFTPPSAPTVQETKNPAAAFPAAPTSGPGRPSKLVASAAPFTPKTAAAATASPTHLDPTAKEFRPVDEPVPEQPSLWRRTRSYEDSMDSMGSPSLPPSYRQTGFERRAMSHESLDSHHHHQQSKSHAVSIQTPVQPKLPKLPKNNLSDEQLSTRHPLGTSWTLWYKGVTAPTADWSGALKTIFTVRDVETFWGVFNQIKAPSTMQKGATYYMFREGIKPMWEDKECAKGGEWRVWVPSSKKGDIDTVWVMVTLLCIGEQMPAAEQVCGVAVETRNKSDRISLWTRTTEKQTAMAIGKDLKSNLVGFVPSEQPITFTSHSKALNGDDKAVDYCIVD